MRTLYRQFLLIPYYQEEFTLACILVSNMTCHGGQSMTVRTRDVWSHPSIVRNQRGDKELVSGIKLKGPRDSLSPVRIHLLIVPKLSLQHYHLGTKCQTHEPVGDNLQMTTEFFTIFCFHNNPSLIPQWPRRY